MSAIILIPAVLSIYFIATRSAAEAFAKVWIPCLMLLPLYFDFRMKHLPPLYFTDAAALPIAVVMVAFYIKKLPPRLMDGLVLALVAVIFLSEARRTGLNTGGLQLFGGLTGCLFPYLAGRIFMEDPKVRAQFIRSFLLLLCAVAILSLWDFLAGISVFQMFWQNFFPGQQSGWPVQTRWGFGRIAGPYGQAILCGMMFLTGIMFAVGMRYFAPDLWRKRLVDAVPLSTRMIVAWVLVAGLLMTQSRGPVFGMLAGLLIVQIARAFNTRRAAILVTLLLAICFGFAYNFLQDYTAGNLTDAKTLEQQNAIYRAHLFDAYSKTIHDGGLLGWGETSYPKAPNLDSIDNEYLLMLVTHGYIGLTLFLLIAFGTLWGLARMLPFATAQADRWLLFSLIGIFVGLLLTLTTVYLGSQVFLLYFLLVGWVQALRSPEIVRLQKAKRHREPMVTVYT